MLLQKLAQIRIAQNSVMKTKYLDTNLILRLIIRDNLDQVKYVQNLLEQSNLKKCKLFTSAVVVFECEWVLRSFYKFSKEDIIKILQKILIIDEIEIENSEILYLALEKMSTNNLGMEDNYHISYSKNRNMELVSFDKKLQNKL